MNIQDKLICPKCMTRNLRKAHGRNPIAEFFCDKDHLYFSIWELVNIWGYDAGDFVNKKGIYILTQSENQNFFDYLHIQVTPRVDTLDMFEGEPIWSSEKERDEAYAMVHRMFLDIPEYNDYQDLKNTQECALDRGIQ